MGAIGQRVLRTLALGAAALVLGGCGVDYYWQSATGHVDMLARSRHVDEVLATTDDARLKERLERAAAIRVFASRELGLPDNGSYRRYVDLGRPYVVWNVFATPAASLQPRQWCFPVAGCVNYRGYFSEAQAREVADRFRASGDDVHIGGVPAYSTLGWFDDPLLSSFVRYPDVALARLIFHELAHQVVYVKDDTSFNESFATVVEEAGLERWIAAQAGSPQYAVLRAQQQRSARLREEFRTLVKRARSELDLLYASEVSPGAKLAGKARVFEAMVAAYDRAKAGEPGLGAYDRWFAGDEGRGPNNASLASVALYEDRVPAFRALLGQVEGDLLRFYAEVGELAKLPRAERDAALARLAGAPPLRSVSR